MALGDIYQVRVLQSYLGEVCTNVFYYTQTSLGSGGSEDLYNEFSDNVWDVVRAMQSDLVFTNRFEIINGMNNEDFHYTDVSSVGSYTTGLALPAFLAVGFRSPPGGPGTRYSYKRFAGLRTGAISSADDGGIGGPFQTSVGYDTSIALGIPLEGAEGSYVPCQITGGFALGVAPTLARIVPNQWSMNAQPTHQDTRQQFLWFLPSDS